MWSCSDYHRLLVIQETGFIVVLFVMKTVVVLKDFHRKQTDGTLLALLSRLDRFDSDTTNTIDTLKLHREHISSNIEKLVQLSLEIEDLNAITNKLKQLKMSYHRLMRISRRRHNILNLLMWVVCLIVT